MSELISVEGNPELFYKLDGWVAPAKDRETYSASLREVGFLANSIRHCRQHRTVIQAGANIGVFPRALAGIFEQVYSAEPDLLNYVAAKYNTQTCDNVTLLRAGFGYDRMRAKVHEPIPGNASAYQVIPGDDFDVVRIDDLGVVDCDLLLLDVEGFELYALQGAMETIAASSPVICLEMKSFFLKKYGLQVRDIRAFMDGLGYTQKEAIERRDYIFVKRSVK